MKIIFYFINNKKKFFYYKICKITPKLNISHSIPYVFYLSRLRLAISGATYPGVPHRINKYSSILE